jgi:hypothetical protein
MRHARLDLVNEAEDARGVRREDGGRKPVLGIVRYRQRFVEIPDAKHGEHRAEHLFARNAHVGRHMVKNGRAHKVAFIKAVAFGALAAAL